MPGIDQLWWTLFEPLLLQVQQNHTQQAQVLWGVVPGRSQGRTERGNRKLTWRIKICGSNSSCRPCERNAGCSTNNSRDSTSSSCRNTSCCNSFFKPTTTTALRGAETTRRSEEGGGGGGGKTPTPLKQLQSTRTTLPHPCTQALARLPCPWLSRFPQIQV